MAPCTSPMCIGHIFTSSFHELMVKVASLELRVSQSQKYKGRILKIFQYFKRTSSSSSVNPSSLFNFYLSQCYIFQTSPKISFLQYMGFIPKSPFLNVGNNTSWYMTCQSQNHFFVSSWTCPKVSYFCSWDWSKTLFFWFSWDWSQNHFFDSSWTYPCLSFACSRIDPRIKF